jgi:hypothetical protein
MRKLVLILGCVLLLGACATPQITIPAGQAAIFYAQARSDYATAKIIVLKACGGPVLTPQGQVMTTYLDKESCEALRVIDIQAQTLRTAVEKALLDARAPIDWGQVMAYAATVSEMLIKLGVLAVK